jgi:predicted HTH transcriptional regulator
VKEKKLLTLKGFKDLWASDKFRLLFSSLGIPLDIPPATPALQGLASSGQMNWIDAPHSLTEIRNSLVHPEHKHRGQLGTAFHEAWNLGLWYLEMGILAVCGYSGTYGMSTDYIIRLGQQRSQTRMIRFDEQPVVPARVDALDPTLYERFRTPRTRDEGLNFLQKLGLVAQDDEGIFHPSVAGILMACREPREWMPNAFIQAVAYRGTSPVTTDSRLPYQLDARDISGPLDEQVRESCRFVARNMKVAGIKDLGRRDTPQYDLTAVFEAMVNAVAHRDYAIYGSKVRLKMFADRLELYSPGTIPNTMTVESLLYRQAARNEALTSLLAKCSVPTDIEWVNTDRRTLMDKRGEGVRIIMENSERLSGKRPVYRLIDDSELLLTIFSASMEQADED